MEYSGLIIILLVLLLFYTNKHTMCNIYHKLHKTIYPSKNLQVNSPMDKVNELNTIITNSVNDNIDKSFSDQKIKKACLYLLSNTIKLRPIIVLSVYRQLTNASDFPSCVTNLALAIEYIYCVSTDANNIMNKNLINIETSSVTSQFCPIMLCSLAHQNFTKSIEDMADGSKDVILIINKLISDKINNLVLGQLQNAQYLENAKINKEIDQIDIIHKKTSSLFELCFILPWIYANKNIKIDYLTDNLHKIKKISKIFGLVYQIANDFDTYTDGNNVLNYVTVKGKKTAYSDYNKYSKQFMTLANKNKILSRELSEIINYLNDKTKINYSN